MKKWLLILIILCQSLAVFSAHFKHIGMRDGLSQTSVMSIHQDVLGRMWFGTREGITIYDGNTTTVFKPGIDASGKKQTKAAFGNRCDFIRSNKEGDVFFRSDDALIRYDIRKQKFYTLRANSVKTLASHNGELWCAVRDSLFTYDASGDSLLFRLKTNIQTLSCLLVLDHQIWLGSDRGLYLMENGSDPKEILPNLDIYSLFQSSTKDLYIGSRMNGLYKIAPDGAQTVYRERESNTGLTIASDQVREFIEDHQGNIWFGTFKGLQRYNPVTEEFALYTRNNLPGGLTHSSVFSLCFDHQGTIWAGTYYGGVNYFNPERDIFSYYVDNPSRNDCLSYPFVGKMIEDKQGDLWICTEGGGLNYLNRQTHTFRHFLAEDKNGPPHNNLKSISYDRKRDRIYIGTHTGGLAKFDIPTQRFHYFVNKTSSYPGEIIHHTEIYNDHLYISARNGLFKMNLETELFTPLNLYCVNFHIDSEGFLWYPYSNRLTRVNLNNLSDKKELYPEKDGVHLGITQITEFNGDIYFGTLGSGFYKYSKADSSFTAYTVAGGHLTSDYCYDLAPTQSRHLVITGDKGITFFDPQKETSRFVKLGVSLPITSITEGCGLLICDNGEIFVGATDGMTSFKEEELNLEKKDYSLYFSDIQIHNTKIVPEDDSRVLLQALPFTSDLRLRYNQNNIVVGFASTNYVDIQKNNEYEYTLEGFDTNWNPANRDGIYYTNLNPGEYRLIVREKTNAFNPTGVQEIALNIAISQPWYNTVWAWMAYLLVTSSVLAFIIYTRNSRRALALSLEKEQQEKERNEKLTQAKLHFFTNISHEFRVPLTLITSQIDLIFQKTTLSPAIYNQLLKISKNANRMRGLINELLEFRKLEQHFVTLRVSEQPLVPFLKDIYLSFRELASQKEIDYRMSFSDETLTLWFDTYQLQKVFYNLLSNAFKFTHEKGSVELAVKEEANSVTIQIIDTGIGLTPDEAKRIFDLFYQAESTVAMTNIGSRSGIGLTLSKNIVQLHHGEIEVQSERGYGTILSVRLLKGKEHFEKDKHTVLLDQADEAVEEENTRPEMLSEKDYKTLADSLPETNDGKQHTILLVEDNEELLYNLQILFKPLYRVLSARDGKEGLDIAVKEKPDLIVSDVMMPRMTGTELCMHIKNNIDLCHIPVVLLTALDSVEKNIEGLQQGADDYIAKPFHSKMLLIRCNTIIRNRILMQRKLDEQPDFELPLLAVNTLDQNLLKRINEVIEERLADPRFDVDQLAAEAGLSRSSLFTKFKALTGVTPNEFIRNQRLKRAAILLREQPELAIVEIAEQFGFGSSVYFCRIFKSHYGVSPTQYRKQ